jgi:hypothetical protein
LKKTQRSLCIDSAKNGKSEEVMKEWNVQLRNALM